MDLPHSGDLIASRYRIEALIARGGTSVIYRARDATLGHVVALKVMSDDFRLGASTHVERFLNEARGGSGLRSEHIAWVLDAGRLDDGRPFLVMEYLSGIDLAKLLRRQGPLPVWKAVRYTLEALVGIAHAHAAGVIHRDIKPSNLVVTNPGSEREVVKVVDFGIAKFSAMDDDSGDLTGTQHIFGTPRYMSPEQLRSTKHVDARTDVWSLGVTLYELLTGVPPFDGGSAGAVTASIYENPRPSARAKRSDIPLELDEIIAWCLERDLSRRCRDVGALATALAPFCGKSGPDYAAAIGVALQTPPSPDVVADVTTNAAAIETLNDGNVGEAETATLTLPDRAPGRARWAAVAVGAPVVVAVALASLMAVRWSWAKAYVTNASPANEQTSSGSLADVDRGPLGAPADSPSAVLPHAGAAESAAAAEGAPSAARDGAEPPLPSAARDGAVPSESSPRSAHTRDLASPSTRSPKPARRRTYRDDGTSSSPSIFVDRK